MEQLGDYVFRCISCGFKIDERQGDTALHNRVLVSTPSIYHIGKKYIVKEGLTRSQYFRKIRKEFDSPNRVDRQSMYNPLNAPEPGRSNRGGQWMNVHYANLSLDYTEDELNKMFDKRRH
jgi:hypothetical protein